MKRAKRTKSTKPKKPTQRAAVSVEALSAEIRQKIELLAAHGEGVPLIAMLADIQHQAVQLAEKEAGIETDTESAHKAIGLLLLGIQRTADTRNTTHDAIVVELLDKLGAPHGIPTHAWN